MRIDPATIIKLEFGTSGCEAEEHMRVPAERLLREIENQLLDSFESGTAFVTDVFYFIALSHICGSPFDGSEFLKYLHSLKSGKGFRAAAASTSRSAVLRTALEQPTLYATYAAILSIALLGEDAGELLDNAGTLVADLMKESGWIYNSAVGDTQEERKFHNELSREALSAVRLLGLSSRQSEKSKVEQLNEVATALADRTPYVSVMASLAEVLRAGGAHLPSRTGEFLMSHFDPSSGGFVEYLMEEAKRDEVAGQVQRYAHDVLEPSIVATFRAVQVLRYGPNVAEAQVLTLLDGATRFFASLASMGAGFGTPVKIAKFPESLGPIATLQETAMVLLAPCLISEARR